MKLRTRFFIMLGFDRFGSYDCFPKQADLCAFVCPAAALDLVQIALIGILIAAVGLAWGHCTIRCTHCGRDVDWR